VPPSLPQIGALPSPIEFSRDVYSHSGAEPVDIFLLKFSKTD
jgi:hypothetical protein